jgi:hypothetical protein
MIYRNSAFISVHRDVYAPEMLGESISTAQGHLQPPVDSIDSTFHPATAYIASAL